MAGRPVGDQPGPVDDDGLAARRIAVGRFGRTDAGRMDHDVGVRLVDRRGDRRAVGQVDWNRAGMPPRRPVAVLLQATMW